MTTGRASRSRRCGGSAATAFATCRRSRPRCPRRPDTATCCARRRAPTPTRGSTTCSFGSARRSSIRGWHTGSCPAATRASTDLSAPSIAYRAGRPPGVCRSSPTSSPGSRMNGSVPWSRSCESLEILGRRRGGVGGIPLLDLPRPPRLGRDGTAGRASRRPRASIPCQRAALSSSWQSACFLIASAWRTRPGTALGYRRPARRAPGRGSRPAYPARAAQRRAAGVPGLSARPGARPLARRAAIASISRNGRRSSVRSRPSPSSSAARLPPGL